MTTTTTTTREAGVLKDFLLVVAGGLVAVATQTVAAWTERKAQVAERKRAAVLDLMRAVSRTDEPLMRVRNTLDDHNIAFAEALTFAERELVAIDRQTTPERMLVDTELRVRAEDVFRTTGSFLRDWSESIVNQTDFDSAERWSSVDGVHDAFWSAASSAARTS